MHERDRAAICSAWRHCEGVRQIGRVSFPFRSPSAKYGHSLWQKNVEHHWEKRRSKRYYPWLNRLSAPMPLPRYRVFTTTLESGPR